MLIIWGYFGTKLFRVLRQENFLTGYISSGFYCIQQDIKCAGSVQSHTELNINGECYKMPVEALVSSFKALSQDMPAKY